MWSVGGCTTAFCRIIYRAPKPKQLGCDFFGTRTASLPLSLSLSSPSLTLSLAQTFIKLVALFSVSPEICIGSRIRAAQGLTKLCILWPPDDAALGLRRFSEFDLHLEVVGLRQLKLSDFISAQGVTFKVEGVRFYMKLGPLPKFEETNSKDY